MEVVVPVFVVEFSPNDLLLGRPWERAARCEQINEDDGTLTVRIKSPDGRRIVTFTGCKADHERNRSYARHADENSVGNVPLKV